MDHPIKISFWGTPGFALPALQALIDAGYSIAPVVTVPDMPVGREQVITSTPVKQLALHSGLHVITPRYLSDNTFFEEFKNAQPEAVVIVAYGKIIPERYLNIPPHGFINIHPSLLPKYRGPSPIQTAIAQGEKETGITIMLIDKEMDHGPILAQEKYEIDLEKYFSEIADDLAHHSADLLLKTLPRWISGQIKPQEQDQTQATFTKIINQEDGKIDWKESATTIYNKIRAYSMEPGTWTHLNSLLFKIYRAQLYNVEEISSYEPGTILVTKDQFLIKTGQGWIAPQEIQLQGKRLLTAKEFIRGYRHFNGIIAQ